MIIDCGIYPYDILVHFGTKEKLNKKLERFGLSTDEDCGNGLTIHFSTLQTVIWMKSKPSNINELAILNHEILHAVMFILDSVNIKLSKDSDEAFTYFYEYVCKKIYKKLKIKFNK